MISAVAALMAVHAGLLAYSATQHSPTMLEPAFLAAGVSHWEFGRFELYRVNPPLVRMWAALPVLAVGYQADWTQFRDGLGARSEFAVGGDFIRANGERSIQLIVYARWACIPLSLIGAYFAYRWANELYGGGAGLVTLTLWCFEPNLLAHAELITPDSACTSFGVAAAYFFWKWLESPRWTGAGLAGMFLGLAELSKMSWLILFGVWPALWIAWQWFGRKSDQAGAEVPVGIADIHSADEIGNHSRKLNIGNPQATIGGNSSHLSPSTPLRRETFQLATILLIGVYVLNLGYAFDGSFAKLKDFTFFSRLMTGLDTAGSPGNRFVDSCLSDLWVPVPRQFLLGFDAQRKDLEQFGEPSYLRGEWKHGGWWYYYIYGLLVKVPCGSWLLFVGILAFRVCYPASPLLARRELVLAATALSIIVLVSAHTEFNTHLRYVFPSLGLSLIFLGQAVRFTQMKCVLVRATVVSLLGYSVISGLLAFPHHLAYFNDFVGGTVQGHRHLLGSSFDWGQDLLVAARWVHAHESSAIGHPICLYTNVLYDPAHISSAFGDPRCVNCQRWTEAFVNNPRADGSIGLISASRLAELAWTANASANGAKRGESIDLTWKTLRPIPCASIRYSINNGALSSSRNRSGSTL